ncbi:formin 1, putative [Plasmodium knowlesi strain H]|uniref:Formin 1, putative n=3 Tax=Plasmodium knowlesi TaxID=5850 RepID=A0A5K1V664_PLAKH|nr:formin 1, putative [Plasmodium knowlesi strain H]OTN66983.1 putative Diaphanous-like protein [Plasmodium knowlesi]CAA9988526.1 formin 1, putative [Plasmodium knowlesi strain H]SBO21299.1 formin 1, putative [Plasmodium knowlesi strain H]SBO21753.1 formin 1, putative [Plasmodium knowlesi strain H]VVS78000.1 formin 1, putative [Plasmodium knowlesi strain H]|eukprot:XP_002259501.1 diaphanous homolog, putative [Plasmodium knowlesi strain H]
MENKKIALATINDIETDKNVDALSMITKIDLKLTNGKNGNSTKIRNINFEDSLRMNDEQIKVKEAVFILHNMENFNYSISYTEIQDIRNDLRLFAINNYHEKKYTDCLIQSIHSYMIAKKYYSKYFGFYITGDMSTELILICKCYVLVEKFSEGKKYLHELKFLIDNTLIYIQKKGILDDQQQKKVEQVNNANKVQNVDSNYEEPVILCGTEVLSNILYIFADLLSLYKQNEEAECYYLKYLFMIEKRFKADSLNYSDALNDVCSYYIKIREYSKALPLCEQILEIRKKFFGDYNAENPNEVIADCYCNWGLLLRLSGNTMESLHKYLIAVDMRMRIHKTRQTIQVQDILLSFAIIMQQLNNFKMSLQLYKEVYSFYKSYYGPDDMNTKVVFKLIEELEKDIMKEHTKGKKNVSFLDAENCLASINEKLKTDNKVEKEWKGFNNKLDNMSKKSDVDPNLIHDLMNEHVLINTRNITSENLSNRRTFISMEGKLKYNDLNYSSIDAYKHMQSNKEFEIFKSSFFTISSINRIKSLYADSWKSTLIPSTYILPFVETKLADDNLVKYAQCKDFQNAIIYKRKILPIVNVPLIERGYVKLENDQPIMICNDDAKVLLSEWNIKEPFVDSKGKVISKYEDLDNEFNMFISILDENNEVMLGFYNNPLLVPNPAIHHCLILGDPYYFHRYNQVNNLYSFDNLNMLNKKHFKKKFHQPGEMNRLNVNEDNSNLHDSVKYEKTKFGSAKPFGFRAKNSFEEENSTDGEAMNKEGLAKPNERLDRSNPKYLMKGKNLVNEKSQGKSKKDEAEGEALKDEKKGRSGEGRSEVEEREQQGQQSERNESARESRRETMNHVQDQSRSNAQTELDELNQLMKKMKSKEERQVKRTSKIFNDHKEAPKKKVPIKKVHVLKIKNNNSSSLFSREKYALKSTGKLSSLFSRPKERIKLIGYSNSKEQDKLEKTMREIKLNKEPILKASIDHNIRLDLQSNMNNMEQHDIDNLKREIYYENAQSNSHSDSDDYSSGNDIKRFSSYKEYHKYKGKEKKPSTKLSKGSTSIGADTISNCLNESDDSVESSSDCTTSSCNQSASHRKASYYRKKIYTQDCGNDDHDDIIDICKILDVNQSYESSNQYSNANSPTGKNGNEKRSTSSYHMNYANNAAEQPSEQSNSSFISEKNNVSEMFSSEGSSTSNGRKMYKEHGKEKSDDLVDDPSAEPNMPSKNNTLHMKDKINEIKNVNNRDILFKFKFNHDSSLSKGNVFSDSDISESELYANPFGSEQDSGTKWQSNGCEIMEDGHSSEYSSFHRKKKQVVSSSKDEDNKINTSCEQENLLLNNKKKGFLKDKELTGVKRTVEEIVLSENEEFYEEIIFKEEKINAEITDTSETQKSDNMTYMNGEEYSKVCYQNGYFSKIYQESQPYQLHEETSSQSQKNELTDMDKESFTDNLYFRSNSIEELDSNLITNKYISNNIEKETSKEESLNGRNNITNDLLNQEMDNTPNTKAYKKRKGKKFVSNNKRLDENEADISLSDYHDSYSSKNGSVNIVYCRPHDNNEQTRRGNTNDRHITGTELCSNLSNSSVHSIRTVYSDNNVTQECDINYDYSFYSNVGSDNNSNNIKGNKKKKKAKFLHPNKGTKFSKLLSFFSKKNKKKKLEKSNSTSNGEPAPNELSQLNKENKDAPFPNDLFSNISIDKKREEDVSLTNNAKLRNLKKKRLFLSEPLHGMDKPKLGIKSKGLGLKKMLMIKKGIFSKNNVIEKKESLSKDNEVAAVEVKGKMSPLNKSSEGDAGTGEAGNSNNGSDPNNLSDASKASKVPEPSGDANTKDQPIEKANIKEHITKGAKSKDKSVTRRSSKEITNDDETSENKNEMSEKVESKFSKKMNPVNVPKKIIVKKIVPKIVVNKEIIIKDKNNIKKSMGMKYEVKTVKKINEKLAFDVLRKVKYCKIGFESDETLGTLPTVHLLNEDKTLIAIVPWQLDLTSFSLAKSSVEEETIKKIGLMHRKLDLSIEERKNQVLNENRLLTGEGLKELGFTSTPTSKVDIHSINLLEGIDTNALKNAYKIEKKSEPKEKTPTPKKEAPKMAPKEKGGKKGGPKFMKGPPKGVKGGPVLGKGKGKVSIMKQAKDEGKTKRFFWEALFEDDIPGTLFEDKKELISKIAIEKESVEKSFAKAVSKKEETGELKIKKPKVIQLLPDSKREYNMSIALSKFNNYTFKEIRDAIMDLNPKILNIDNTEVLMQYVPTPEEFEIVKEYILSNGDLNLVDKPEQYVAALMGVPLLKQRLESHYFALSFKENYENTLTPLENILESCEAVKNSTKLFTILFTILNVGNTLNYGDPQRGNAFGFKLTTLAKLNDIRSTTKPVKTLLQYICEIIFQKSEDTLEIIEELRSIEKVTKTDKQIIDSLLQKLKMGSNKIKNVLDLAKNNPDDPLYEALKEFYFSVEPKIEELDTFYNQTFAVFKEIALYLGYKEKEVGNIQVQDFFKELWKFIQSIEFNRKTIKEATLKELKKKEKELENAKKGAVLNKKQNFTIVKKQDKEPKTKLEKKTFKIF